MSLKYRKAKIVRNTNNTDDDRKLRASINIVGRIPLFSLEQQAGYGNGYQNEVNTANASYNLTIKETTIDSSRVSERNNILFDDDENRFTPIATCTTQDTQRDGILFYDTKYMDIILIPDLSSLGLEDITHQEFVIEGYIIGGNCGLTDFNALFVNVVDSDNIVSATKIDNPQALDSKLHYMNINLGKHSKSTRLGVGTNNTDYYETDFIRTSSIIGLGSTDHVFGGPTKVYKAIRTTGSEYRFFDLGYTNVDQLTFQMPWE